MRGSDSDVTAVADSSRPVGPSRRPTEGCAAAMGPAPKPRQSGHDRNNHTQTHRKDFEASYFLTILLTSKAI